MFYNLLHEGRTMLVLKVFYVLYVIEYHQIESYFTLFF